MFFVGLFILVHGLEASGVIKWMAEQLIAATAGDKNVTIIAILWGSAILSAFIDNIPFVATMIPMIKAMAPTFGGEQALMPFWWALSLGACLGGNGTLIGASANLVVAGMAERAGHTIRFVTYMKSSFGLMIMSIAICHVYMYIRYL
jgi:Na+/H+ antiporter NhaD/arsenite permease-like protein